MKSICLSLASAAKDIPPPPRVWSTASSQLYQPRSLPLPTDMNRRSAGVHKKWVSKQICQPRNLMRVRLIFAALTCGISLKWRGLGVFHSGLQSGEWSSSLAPPAALFVYLFLLQTAAANTSTMSCSLITGEGEDTRGSIILQRRLII